MTPVDASQVRLVLAVLVPGEPLLIPQAPQSSSQSRDWAGGIPRSTELGPARFLDPYHYAAMNRSDAAWVEMRLGTDNRPLKVDLPHRNPDDLLDLLETLYVLYGWDPVDDLIEMVSRSLVTTVSTILGLP